MRSRRAHVLAENPTRRSWTTPGRRGRMRGNLNSRGRGMWGKGMFRQAIPLPTIPLPPVWRHRQFVVGLSPERDLCTGPYECITEPRRKPRLAPYSSQPACPQLSRFVWPKPAAFHVRQHELDRRSRRPWLPASWYPAPIKSQATCQESPQKLARAPLARINYQAIRQAISDPTGQRTRPQRR
jgi:hypothetical protein